MSRRASWLAAAAALLVAGAARAEVPAAIRVAGPPDGACPSASSVAAVLGQLLPRSRVAAVVEEEESEVRVRDLGVRYRVEVGGEAREVLDAERSCDERARSAAVYAALIIDPPSVMGLPSGDPAPPARPASRELRLDVEAAGAVLIAPRTGEGERALVTGGGGLRLVGTWGFAGLAIGARGLAPATIADDRLRPGSALVTRVPVEVDLRLGLRRGRVELFAEAGAEVAVVVMEGRGFDENRAGTRVEAGLRAQMGMRLWIGERVAPLVAVEAAWVPRTHDLVLDPRGVVASTPPVWIGVSLGVAFRVR